MQQIERVGVVALLFLLVTIVTVAMWDEGGEGDGTAGDGTGADRIAAQGPALEGLGAGRDPAADAGLRVVPARQTPRTRAPLYWEGDGPGAPRTARRSWIDERPHPEAPREASRPGPTEAGTSTRALDLPGRGPRGPRDPGGDRMASADPTDRGLRSAGFRRERGEPRGRESSRLASPGEQAPVAGTPAGGRTYVVRSGDTLGGIALRELGDRDRWPEIQRLNGGLDPRRVIIGTTLVLPEASSRPDSRPSPQPNRPRVAAGIERQGEGAGSAPRTYVVQPGDILGRISQRTLGSAKRWREIAALNPGIDPRKLVIGTRLRLPGGEPPREPLANLSVPGRKGGNRGYVVR